MMKRFTFLAIACIFALSLSAKPCTVKMGAERTAQYFHLLRNKRVAVLSNQTSTVGKEHLVDVW